jgi:hypothetical protein
VPVSQPWKSEPWGKLSRTANAEGRAT